MITQKNQPAGAGIRATRHAAVFVAALAILAVSVARPAPVHAERLGSETYGYSLDLPEGYSLAEKNGSTRYHFVHSIYKTDLQIAIYPKSQFKNADGALGFVTEQLASAGEIVSLEWRHRDAAIAQLSFTGYAGWAIALELDRDKGWIALACYAAADRATALEPLFISTLDSVFTDEGSDFETGPMTAFAWANEKPVAARYDDGRLKLDVPFDAVDAAANQSIVDREYSLLTGYLDTPLIYDAWRRYYRLIYRDAWARFAKASFLVGNALPSEPDKLAAALLAWTQGFTYERNPSGSDFIDLPDAFASKRGDCDSRALLMVLMLNQLGVDAILLVSPEYSHAVAAVDCPGAGARYELNGKKYLIAETTSKVGLGLIDADRADPAKWFAVSFAAFPQKQETRHP
jgi:hypothetical protein